MSRRKYSKRFKVIISGGRIKVDIWFYFSYLHFPSFPEMKTDNYCENI